MSQRRTLIFVSAVLFLATNLSALHAEEILGREIHYSTKHVNTVVRVMKDGHVFIQGSADNCRSSTGEIGGEAIIGQAITRSFTCKRDGKEISYKLSSTASLSGATLRISQNWMEVSQSKALNSTQTFVITINGSNCAGTIGFKFGRFSGNEAFASCEVK